LPPWLSDACEFADAAPGGRAAAQRGRARGAACVRGHGGGRNVRLWMMAAARVSPRCRRGERDRARPPGYAWRRLVPGPGVLMSYRSSGDLAVCVDLTSRGFSECVGVCRRIRLIV
jgi:hypothetical protein